eukprot:2660296-Amphidinium_carterae.1
MLVTDKLCVHVGGVDQKAGCPAKVPYLQDLHGTPKLNFVHQNIELRKRTFIHMLFILICLLQFGNARVLETWLLPWME